MSRTPRRSDDDEEENDALGGWQPVGEAVFWGAVFLGLTLTAFSLSDGGANKLAENPKKDEGKLSPEDDSPSGEDAFEAKIARPEGERESDTRRVDMQTDPKKPTEPPKTVVDNDGAKTATPVSSTAKTPPKNDPPPEFPPTRLAYGRMLKTVVAVAPATRLDTDNMLKTVRVETPTQRLDMAAMQRHVVLSPSTTRLDVEAMLRTATLAPSTQRTDLAALFKPAVLAPRTSHLAWETMLRTAALTPAAARLDYAAMLKSATFEPEYSRVDMRALARMVKFIPLPSAYSEPPPLSASLRDAAAPVKGNAPLAPPPKLSAVALELRTVPPLRKVGDALLVVAKVVGSNKEGLPDQLVEWTIDRQGAGRVLAVPSDAKAGQVGEKLLPTFARTYTATTPQRVDAAWGGVQIQPGETWCVVESPTAGAMHLAVRAPAVAAPTAAAAATVVQWDHAQAEFPENQIAQAGSEALVAARVFLAGQGASAPLPDYRVRYTLTEAGGAALPNGRSSIEVASLADGAAPLALRQNQVGAAVTKGKVELLGRAPLAGYQAPVLSEGVFQVSWTAPDVTLTVNGPTAATVDDWTTLAVAVNAKQPALAQGMRLVAIPPADVEIQASERLGSAYDLGPWPSADGRPLAIAVRHDRPAARTVKFELRQGRQVWGSAEHAIRFVAPDLSVVQKTLADWRIGQQASASVVLQNRGLAAANNVRVRCEVPDRFRVVDPKQARIEGNALVWTLDRVEAGSKATLDFVAAAKTEGAATFKATVSGRHFLEPIESALEATVQGRPSLAVAIRDSADPVTVNGELEYTIAIENQGSAPARDVAVEVVQTAGVELLEAKGTLGGETRGGRYEPLTVKEIPPRGKLVQTLRVKAAEKGDARLVVRLKHPSLPNGQVEEHESTVVYVP